MLSFKSKVIIFNIFVRVNQIKGVSDLKMCMGYFVLSCLEQLLMFEFLFHCQNSLAIRIADLRSHVSKCDSPVPNFFENEIVQIFMQYRCLFIKEFHKNCQLNKNMKINFYNILLFQKANCSDTFVKCYQKTQEKNLYQTESTITHLQSINLPPPYTEGRTTIYYAIWI